MTDAADPGNSGTWPSSDALGSTAQKPWVEGPEN